MGQTPKCGPGPISVGWDPQVWGRPISGGPNSLELSHGVLMDLWGDTRLWGGLQIYGADPQVWGWDPQVWVCPISGGPRTVGLLHGVLRDLWGGEGVQIYGADPHLWGRPTDV